MIKDVNIRNPRLTNPDEVREFKRALVFKAQMDKVADSFSHADQSTEDLNPARNQVMLCDTHIKGLNGTYTGSSAVTQNQDAPAAQTLEATHSFVKEMEVDHLCYGHYDGSRKISLNDNGKTAVYGEKERVPDFYNREVTLSYNKETGTITFDEQLTREVYFYNGTGRYVS